MSVLKRKDADLEMLAAVLRGDKTALDAFFRRFKGLIYSVVTEVYRRYQSLSGFHDADLDDAVQDVYVELLRDDKAKLRAFDPAKGKMLSSWIGMLSFRLTVQNLRLADAMADYSPIDKCLDMHDPTPQPDEKYEILERQARVARAFSKLAPEDQELVLVPDSRGPKNGRSVGKTGFSEYAKRHGKSPGSVYLQRHRLMKELLGS